MNDLERKIAELAGPVATEAGAEVLLVEFRSEGGRWVLRLYLDREGGVRLEDCERVSRDLGPLLDAEGLIDRAYALEVSSPGLDRPLTRAEDFRRYEGREAKVRTSRAVEGARNFRGRILAAPAAGEIALEVDGKVRRIPLEWVERANLVPEF